MSCPLLAELDECETGESCCSQFCINHAGGYECACKAGFQPNADGCACDGECLGLTKHSSG